MGISVSSLPTAAQILADVLDAAGDLVVAAGDDAPVRFPAPTLTGDVLTADTANPVKMLWATPPSGFDPTADETITGFWTFDRDVTLTANRNLVFGATCQIQLGTLFTIFGGTGQIVITDASGGLYSAGYTSNSDIFLATRKASDSNFKWLTYVTGKQEYGSGGAASDLSTERSNPGQFRVNGSLWVTTDTRLGLDGASTLGFYGSVGAGQAVAIPDAAGGATIDAEARTALNAVLQALRDTNYIPT